MLVMWKDAREVFFLSNHRAALTETVEGRLNAKKVPCIRTYYNLKARGVDLANQHCNTYKYNHSEKKWWRTVFEQILQITLSNICIIHNYLSSRPLKKN